MNRTYDIEQLIEQGEVIEISPQGYSMYPLIVPGRDTAVIQRVNVNAIRRGDVILYRRPQDIQVLHRVYKRTKAGLYLVGDNQKEIEGPISDEQVRGIMCGIRRKGREISVQHPIYRLLTGIWLWMRPLRFAIMRPLAAIKRGLKKLRI